MLRLKMVPGDGSDIRPRPGYALIAATKDAGLVAITEAGVFPVAGLAPAPKPAPKAAPVVVEPDPVPLEVEPPKPRRRRTTAA
jgi:hypothetical protein